MGRQRRGRARQAARRRIVASEGGLSIGGMSLAALACRTRQPDRLCRAGARHPRRQPARQYPLQPASAGWGTWRSPLRLVDRPRPGTGRRRGGTDGKLVEVLRVVGLADAVFRFGLASRAAGEAAAPPVLAERISELRARIRSNLLPAAARSRSSPMTRCAMPAMRQSGRTSFGVPGDLALVGARLADHEPTRWLLADLA